MSEPGKRAGRAPEAAGAFVALLSLAAFFAASCGYHVAGRGNALPQEWQTIAIPALKNRTSNYRIEQRFTQALVREMISRTKYRVVPDEKNADAVLEGEISSLQTTPVLFDPVTSRATLMLVTVSLKVRLLDRSSGKPVYQNSNFLFRNEYEISTDIPSFFQEEGPALDRMSREFARSLVSALLEKF
jgi:outer membrane lipopolysaccharide assembly protein LptE/RlpB